MPHRINLALVAFELPPPRSNTSITLVTPLPWEEALRPRLAAGLP
jgi:hypothetical protein